MEDRQMFNVTIYEDGEVYDFYLADKNAIDLECTSDELKTLIKIALQSGHSIEIWK